MLFRSTRFDLLPSRALEATGALQSAGVARVTTTLRSAKALGKKPNVALAARDGGLNNELHAETKKQ